MQQALSILILEDDSHYLALVERLLKQVANNCIMQILPTDNVVDAIKLMEQHCFTLAFVDLSIGGERDAGIKFLEKFCQQNPDTEFVVHSSEQSFSMAQKCIRAGASDYLLKGYSKDEFQIVFNRALDRSSFRKKKNILQSELVENQGKYEILGHSPKVQKIKQQIIKLAKSDAPILIEAETGSGKELVARNLHLNSHYAASPFVAIDCATIPASMAEGFLFGHEKGAFTGATALHIGVFEQANGGTLFLDEITSLPMDLQTKFLRVLEQREIRRLGGAKTIPVSFRLLAAGNQSLEKLVEQKMFKEDLYYRLQAVVMKLPPLRERAEDLPIFLEHFVKGKKMTVELKNLLQNYSWPGNIRECKNLCIALLALAGDDEPIGIQHLPENMLLKFREHTLVNNSPTNLKGWKNENEKDFLAKIYREENANISSMARKLKVDRSHLFHKLKKMGIHKAK